MIVVEHEHVELDYCASCSGVWFDTGELQIMLDVMGLEGGSLSLSEIFTLPEAETTEKKRKCPICHKKMRKTVIGEKPEVLIDRCLNGDGLWFDGGEVRHLISQWVDKPRVELDSRERVLTFLGETFTIKNERESE